VALLGIPVAFGVIRALTTGNDLRYLWLAAAAIAGSLAVAFAGPGKSAEWIEEDTDVNGYISTAPDWQYVLFTGCTVNNVNPGLVSSEAVNIVSAPGALGGLLGQGPIQEDATSNPTSTKNSFSIKWLATGRRSRA